MDGCPPLFGPGFDADPYPAYDWLRRHEPVRRIDLPGGAWAWLVTRYPDARRALADPNPVSYTHLTLPTNREV